MIQIGFLPTEAQPGLAGEAVPALKVVNLEDTPTGPGNMFSQCPKCGQASLIHAEGCDICTACTYSKCG